MKGKIRSKLLELKDEFSYRISEKLLDKLGSYGCVVTKQDWDNIRKNCPQIYREILTNRSCGYSYYYSRAIAMFLKNAEIMYCCIDSQKDGPTAHSVIVKNHCVYCTNARQHFNYDEYVEMMNAKVYKTFPAEEYRKETFFDDIRNGFMKWCSENHAYCHPQ